jgi:hypothetical protein
MQRKLTFKLATHNTLSNSVPQQGIAFDVPTRNVFSHSPAAAALENDKYFNNVLENSCVTGIDTVVNRGIKPCFQMQRQTTTPFEIRSKRKEEGNMNCKGNCIFRIEHPLPFHFDGSNTNASLCKGPSGVFQIDTVSITMDGTNNGSRYIQGRGTNDMCQEVDVDENSWVCGDAFEDMYNPKERNSDCYILRLVHAVMCRGCCTQLNDAQDIEKKQKNVNYVVGVCFVTLNFVRMCVCVCECECVFCARS